MGLITWTKSYPMTDSFTLATCRSNKVFWAQTTMIRARKDNDCITSRTFALVRECRSMPVRKGQIFTCRIRLPRLLRTGGKRCMRYRKRIKAATYGLVRKGTWSGIKRRKRCRICLGIAGRSCPVSLTCWNLCRKKLCNTLRVWTIIRTILRITKNYRHTHSWTTS